MNLARVVEAHDASLYVVEDGDPSQPALLLFSGARCNTGMWDPVMPGLTDSFHVIRHDVRGTGRSHVQPHAALGLDQFADDAAFLLETLGIDRCSVWGMAFGARTALAFASRHSELVTHLALFDASVEAPDPKVQQESVEIARAQRHARGIPEITVKVEWFANDDQATLAATLRSAYAAVDHERYIENITAPTLIATGDCDPNLGASQRLHSRMPSSQFFVLEATGHGSILQRPDLCLATFTRLFAVRE